MIIEYKNWWKSIGWAGKNELTLYFIDEHNNQVQFSLTPEEKDKVTLFQSGYRKGLREGGVRNDP